MNVIDTIRPPVERDAFEFEGRMRPFVGLVAVNLLLTIVTIGIYRFWAKTRVRRYLWSHTRFGGDPLEYHGSGLELLIGALLAFVLILLPLFALSTFGQAMAAQGKLLLFGLANIALMGIVLYVIGVGLYRSRRYLLSRTSWRGIRGGMEAGGWSFGLVYLKLALAQVATLGLATPYTSVRIWNLLMNDASFGSFAFRSEATSRGLYPRFLAALLGSLMVIGGAVALLVSGEIAAALSRPAPGPEMIRTILTLYGVMLVAFFGVALIMANYQAAFMRRVFEATSLGGLRFGIDVSGGALIRFYLGNAAIVVLTLGLGILVMPFRTWSFYLGRLQTEGALDVDSLMQTSLQGPAQGDGIADAFDLAAV